MPRKLRYVPPGGSVVEVTTRTIQGRYLLRPGSRLNELFLGVLGRAQERYSVRIHYFIVMSNHVHLLVSVDDAEQLADFMEYVNGNLAREAGRLHRWSGPFWSRRHQPIVVSDEEEAQVDRLRYLLAQGCKEGLVGSPLEWPGATATRALVSGAKLHGVWVDRTARYWARMRGEACEEVRFESEVAVALTPLPCWADLSAAEYRERVSALVCEIERETAAQRRRAGTQPAGRLAVLRAHPHQRPSWLRRSPAPSFHCASAEAWRSLRDGYREFVEWFREGAMDLRGTDLTGRLPPGSFPPPLAFVRPATARG